MSVKRTVASTRSGSGRGRVPVRNSSISSAISSTFAGGEPVVVAGELDELRAGDLCSEVPPLLDVDVVVAGAVEDERRRVDRREDVPDVDLRVHAQQSGGGAGARAEPQVLLEVPHELLVADRGSARSTRRPPAGVPQLRSTSLPPPSRFSAVGAQG